ncbi:hypothetical protein NliqN6_3651 [Naganishia liquefaciens]|uniref:Uncharacterized protein n=1 Tax=Naganishia liquefaciens TaxID=104408 RepID=A0A8H3YF58_9TREE|nr:hypothetical protein NliqN6_3651 [Naganishia liquefaciens]
MSDDTSDTSDRVDKILVTKNIPDKDGSRTETTRKGSKDDGRQAPGRRTPRKDPETPKRSRRENGFGDLTLDQCPSLLLSLRTTPTDRLRVLRFIEREFAQACHDIDPLGSSIPRFLSRQLHVPLLATFRVEAQNLLRMPEGEGLSASSTRDSLRGFDVLLNVLQGIILVGLRDSSERVGDDSQGQVSAALQENWVVEALIDVLARTQTSPLERLPSNQILNTLFALLVKLPSTLAMFSAAGGYEAVAGLLKMADKEVRVKAVEFLVYLGTLSANNATERLPKDERSDRQADDVFTEAVPSKPLPSTPKRKTPSLQTGPTRTSISGRTSSGISTASVETNSVDIDLLRTPKASEIDSDVEVWFQHRERVSGLNQVKDDDAFEGKGEAFRFPKSKSSSALTSHGFYTPQQRSEKHHTSRISTSGSSQGSQEDSATLRPIGSQSTMRRSSLSVRSSAKQQRIPSLRSLARVEEELALTPKRLVDMSPARLKADFQESEVRQDMCSTTKLPSSSRLSSGLRSAKRPNAKRDLVGGSESVTSAATSPSRGLVRDSSRTSLHAGISSKSTDPKLLIPSGKANIGLGLPGSHLGKMRPSHFIKERTSSDEYPLELAKDPRTRVLMSARDARTEQRKTSDESSTSHNSETPRGMRKSQTLASLPGMIENEGEGITGTMRRGIS